MANSIAASRDGSSKAELPKNLSMISILGLYDFFTGIDTNIANMIQGRLPSWVRSREPTVDNYSQ